MTPGSEPVAGSGSTTDTESPTGYDVVVVGGGPAGCSAGIFLACEGIDTAIFDRGRSSIARCVNVENYLRFPAGIDVDTLYDRMHDHGGETNEHFDITYASDDGWWPTAAEGVDWICRAAELDEEWNDRGRWIEWFTEHHADAPVDTESARFERVREAAIDESRSAYIDAEGQ